MHWTHRLFSPLGKILLHFFLLSLFMREAFIVRGDGPGGLGEMVLKSLLLMVCWWWLPKGESRLPPSRASLSLPAFGSRFVLRWPWWKPARTAVGIAKTGDGSFKALALISPAPAAIKKLGNL